MFLRCSFHRVCALLFWQIVSHWKSFINCKQWQKFSGKKQTWTFCGACVCAVSKLCMCVWHSPRPRGRAVQTTQQELFLSENTHQILSVLCRNRPVKCPQLKSQLCKRKTRNFVEISQQNFWWTMTFVQIWWKAAFCSLLKSFFVCTAHAK